MIENGEPFTQALTKTAWDLPFAISKNAVLLFTGLRCEKM